MSRDAQQCFRFRAQIFDTANTYAITYYIMSIEILGFDLPEYILAKRYSDFFEFHNRLQARFHHKRLPKIPSKTFVKTHDDLFITQRKNALNKYLQGVCERLYLQNALAVWDFFEFTDKVNPYLHRYKVLHLTTLQCNDYRHLPPPPQHAPPKPPKFEELPPPPSPQIGSEKNEQNDNNENDKNESIRKKESMQTNLYSFGDLEEENEQDNDALMKSKSQTKGGPRDDDSLEQGQSSTSLTIQKAKSLFGNLWTNIKEKTKEMKDNSEKAKREWTVIYGAFIDLNTYITVSTIHADNTKNNWWDTMIENVFENQIDADESKQSLKNQNENATKTSDMTIENKVENANTNENENNGNNDGSNNNKNNKDNENENSNIDENGRLLAQRIEDDKDEKESVNSLHTIGLNESVLGKPKQPATAAAAAASATSASTSANTVESKDNSSEDDHSKQRVKRASSMEDPNGLRRNEFYLGKVQLWHWSSEKEIIPKGNNQGAEYLIKPITTFPMVQNRPKCAVFDEKQLLLAVGTSKGKIVLLRVNEQSMKFEMIDWLPHMHGSHVNGMTIVGSDKIFYKPSVISEAIAVDRLPEGSKLIQTSNLNGYLYAVSNDCHLSVYDLKSGNCIGHLQTGITGNLDVCYCFERIFVCNQDNHILSMIRSSSRGTPVPEMDLYGHSKTVTCLCADERNNRLLSGATDNSIGIWYYDKVADRMIQTQHLKSVNKSRYFTSIAVLDDLNCIAAGSDNGFITIWYESVFGSVFTRSESYIESESGSNDKNDNGEPLKEPVFSRNNLKNGAVWSQLSKEKKSWKCLYTWRAHKSEVTWLEYLSQFNALMSCGGDGTVRIVYLCDPKLFPQMQLTKEKLIKYKTEMKKMMSQLYDINVNDNDNVNDTIESKEKKENKNENENENEINNNEEEKFEIETRTSNMNGENDKSGDIKSKEEFKRTITIEILEKKLVPYFEDVVAIDKTQYVNVKQDMLRKAAQHGNEWYHTVAS